MSGSPTLPVGDLPTAAWPQRRGHVRVPSTGAARPMAQLRHPMIPDMRLQLVVADLSLGGCALEMPDNLPLIDPGVLINDVQLQLDDDTVIQVSLRLQYITSIDPDSDALRLGCAFGDLHREDLGALQAYLDRAGAPVES